PGNVARRGGKERRKERSQSENDAEAHGRSLVQELDKACNVPLPLSPVASPTTTSPIITTPSPKGKGKGKQLDPTAPPYRQFTIYPQNPILGHEPEASYDTSALLAAFSPERPVAVPSPVDSDLQSTQSTKDRRTTAMSQLKDALGGTYPPGGITGQDAFDSIDWDPDLPSASGADSPEPVALKPQPVVTYTTVGSLVDPNAKPTFAAPNRIQREGASRQPLISAMQRAHQFEAFHRAMNPPPPTPSALSMSNSMAYTQQIAKSPVHASKPTLQSPQILQRPSRTTPSHQMPPLTDKEMETLARIQNPQMMSGNVGNAGNQPKTPSTTSTSSSKLCAVAPPFATKEHTDAATAYSSVGSLSQGIMDNLGLGQGSVGQGNSNVSSRTENERRYEQAIDAASKFENALTDLLTVRPSHQNENVPPGFLDRTYQFPPPGLQAPRAAQTNPLLGAQTAVTLRPAGHRSHPPGYPQPLTAGPPGQRQANPRATPTPLENIWNTTQSDYTSNTSHDPLSGNTRLSPFWPNYYAAVVTSNVYATGQCQLPAAIRAERKNSKDLNSRYIDPFAPKPINDTLPPDAVAKYFPWGIPSDMTGVWQPMSDENQKKIDGLELTPTELIARSQRELDDNFYYGQRRYATMDGEAYVAELEERQNAAINPFGPIAPPKKVYPAGPAATPQISVEEMEKMSIAEAAKPGLDAAFGTLLSYRYIEQGPTSRSHLSQFVTAPKWQIDDSEKGNQSLFGEDWGAPPKRFGRDSRRQPPY
ncbi:hypothetical protein HYFRA_00010822, partial [Hymenoscyphus fraxineus]